MNEDYSELIKNFSNILKEKNIDINSVLDNNNTSQNSNNSCENNYSDTNFNNNNNNDNNNPLGINIGIEEIIKIKSLIEKMNNEENSNRNQLLYSLKPFLPNSKKEKLEQLIKLSSLLTALELLEHKNIFGLDLNSNTIIVIILILIIL